MAFDMKANLLIGAAVTGTEQINKLTTNLNQVGGAASNLLKSVGPLGGALGAIAPAVTLGGLTAMVHSTIEAGDAMNDLSQRTGVSVESLGKFKKAAELGGTSIDNVAKSLVQLSKKMYSGEASSSLTALGLSAYDASGKLKSADAVLLEVSNKFKNMPDGVDKTALAVALFGRTGQELIPMLNEGSAAIEKFSSKIDTAFAKKADQYNDKLAEIGFKVKGVAASLTIALLPALDVTATVVLKVVDAMTKLPNWMQTIIGLATTLGIAFLALAPALTAASTLLAGLGSLSIVATIGGWISTFASLAAGVATFVASIVTLPVLIGVALVAAGVAIFMFRDKIGAVFQNIWETIADSKTGFIALIGMAWNNAIDAMGQYLQDLVKPVTSTWNSIVNSIKGAINGAISIAGQGINALIDQANRLLSAYNSVANVTRLPQVALIQPVQVPQFAQGGRVDRPTILQAGEVETEYIVPKSKVPQFVGAHMGDAGLGIGPGGGRGGYAAPVVNVSVGAIMQQPDGSQWFSREDAESMAADVADQIWRGLTSYDGRRALGLVR